MLGRSMWALAMVAWIIVVPGAAPRPESPPIILEAGTVVTFEPLAVYAASDETFERLVVNAPLAIVHVGWSEKRYARAPLSLAGLGDTEFIFNETRDVRSFPLTNVEVTLLQGDHRGHFGFYPASEGVASFLAGRGGEVEVRDETTMGNRFFQAHVVSDDGARPEEANPNYYAVTRGPHVFMDVPGTLVLHGMGGLKLAGPDVRITGDENVTEIRTGARLISGEPAGLTGARTWEWVFLEFPEGTIEFFSPELPVEIAGRNASLAPTSLAPATTAAPILSGAIPWGPLAALATVMGGLMAAGVAIHRLRRGEEPGLEDCTAYAEFHADRGAWGPALEWTRRAQEHAPRSARLALYRATFLAELGEVEEALEAYAFATGLAPEDATPHWQAARLILETQPDPAPAVQLLQEALRLDPTLAADLEGEPFTRLRGDRAFEALKKKARAAGSGPEDPGRPW